ncbi:MAG: hypothetical protein KJ714_05610 [Euryarchaeota archaeon]|nr:hypothetical protein [Euryarchaeota archaeon]
MKPTYNPFTGKFDYIVSNLLEIGTRNHNDLQNKEVAGVIDHADASVSDAKLISGVGLSDTQIAKLPTATEGKILRRGAAAWEAGDTGLAAHAAVAQSVHNFDAAGDAPPQTHDGAKHTLTQNDVTASRVKDAIYRNTTGKPMWVNAMFAFSAKSTIIAYSDEKSDPTTVVALHTMEAYTYGGVSFIVLPNNYYKVVLGAGGVGTIQWLEWY